MAKREVIDCDRCGARAITGSVTVGPTVGWQVDGAGGPSESVVERVDLCVLCARVLLDDLLHKQGEKETLAWVQQVKKHKKG